MATEIDAVRELTLRNVTVYTYPESEEMYTLDYIYLSLAKDDVIIENLKPEPNEQGQTPDQRDSATDRGGEERANH